jgi:hypothetical protein
MKTTMEYKGFKAEIMEAPRLVGDHVFDLPEGRALQVYYADEFLHPPGNWMKGQGVFVVPIRPNKGLWFNWRGNDELNTAVLPTIKGANPITGLRTSGFHMEKYEDKCPKHGCDFMADRFCPECDFKWPERNYCSMNPLWWDGFRADDGTVRQFFFSEDELRDVASHLIGKENVVHAYGFTFFTPKERREHPTGSYSRGMSGSIFHLTSSISPGKMGSMINDSFVTSNSDDVHIYNTSFVKKGIKAENKMSDTLGKEVSFCSAGGPIGAPEPVSAAPVGGDAFVEDSGEECSGGGIISSGIPLPPMKKTRFIGETKKKSFSSKGELRGMQVNSTPRSKPVKEVSIGAGAKIRQALNADSYPLDSWKEIPDASMTIYFIFHEKFEELKAKGMRDISGAKEGMLANIPVG